MNETTRRILEERARDLARPREDIVGKPVDAMSVVCFDVGNEQYAFATHSVRETLPLRDVSAIPCTPPFVRGIINLRGQILTVLDLRPLFGLSPRNASEDQYVVVLRTGGSEAGIVADRITGLRAMKREELQATLPTFDEIRQDVIDGVARDGLVILDAAKLLSHPVIVVNEEVAAGRTLENKPPATKTT